MGNSMTATSKVNPVRRYMFLIEKPPYLDPNSKVIVDMFVEIGELTPSVAVEQAGKFGLRTRFNPRLHPKPLVISGEDLDLTAEGLEKYLESLDAEAFVRFVEKAEI